MEDLNNAAMLSVLLLVAVGYLALRLVGAALAQWSRKRNRGQAADLPETHSN
jgi:hypothetical protein